MTGAGVGQHGAVLHLPGLIPLDPHVVYGALVGTLLCLLPYGWPLARLAVTAVHELGHASACLVTGARVQTVTLRLDTSGETAWVARRDFGRFRRGLVAASGYPAPSLVGLLGGVLIGLGHSRAWLVTCAAVAVVVLALWVRTAWGVVSVLASSLLSGALAWYGSEWSVTLAASASAAVLLVGGWRVAMAHLFGRENLARRLSDAGALAKVLWLPALVWSAVFALVSTATLAAVGWILVGRPP